jgi:hypothetical protein
MQNQADGGLVRAALFVDFDNIYITLREQDENTANQFATNPDRWLTWLERQMPCQHVDPGIDCRRILIRRCYLNPASFSAFRPYFIKSAFEVIDCPPLTSHGKTSSDIHMVMDVLDALSHTTCFNEFIILSADADFTPVLLRLRKHDRRSAVLAVGYASPAYKAACDYLIPQDEFIRNAAGINEQSEEDLGVTFPEKEISDALALLLDQMAARLKEEACVPDGIPASDLPAIYKEFQGFRQSNHWLGFYSLRSLTEALTARRTDLVILEEDPWRVTLKDAAQIPPQAIRIEIAKCIKNIVAESQTPVPMATLAGAIKQRFAEYLGHNWLGAESFKNLLESLDLGDLKISALRPPGFVYDAKRHKVPGPSESYDPKQFAHPLVPERIDEFSTQYPDLAPLVQKIHQLTDAPYLPPKHYALLLNELAREINESGYQMTRTSKTVRDRCVEKGAPVARSHVNFVLIGISYTGYRLGQDTPETPAKLGEALVKNIINLCRTAQLSLDANEESQVHTWIMGGIE